MTRARHRRPYGRWTPQARIDFLARLAHSGNIGNAAAACGLSRQAAYGLRRRDPAFAQAWDAVFAPITAAPDVHLESRLNRTPRSEVEAHFLRLLRQIRAGWGGAEIFSRTPSTDQPV